MLLEIQPGAQSHYLSDDTVRQWFSNLTAPVLRPLEPVLGILDCSRKPPNQHLRRSSPGYVLTIHDSLTRLVSRRCHKRPILHSHISLCRVKADTSSSPELPAAEEAPQRSRRLESARPQPLRATLRPPLRPLTGRLCGMPSAPRAGLQ